MFAINDFVVTKHNGICQIITQEIGQDGDVIYMLEAAAEPGTVIRAPYESGELVRKIISKDEADELVDRIPYLTTLKIPRKNMLEEIFESAMEQYEAVDWVKIVKTAYQTEKEGRLSNKEKALTEQAKAYLHRELSLALDIPFEKIEDYIQESVKNSF